MFFEMAKKVLTTGLGVAVITKEKAEAVIQEWVKEGELSRDEGRELLDTWTKRIEEEREEIRSRVRQEVAKVSSSAGLVTGDELRELEERVKILEQRLTQDDPS